MRLLRPGQDTVLSWDSGAIECTVVAAAGHYVLLRPDARALLSEMPGGECSLTYLDGMVPMGWDGLVEFGGQPGELRFRVRAEDTAADRRSSVRVPLRATVEVEHPDGTLEGAMMDVSAGGLRFRHQGRLPVGTLVRVRSSLHEGLEIDADAVVRMSEPGVTAVEFTVMHGSDGQAIGAWTVGILRASLAGRG
jgi:hypothetical protein